MALGILIEEMRILMIGLVQVQFAENKKRLWFYVFLVLFLNSLIATTQLSWDYYIERHSFWNIVLNVTNSKIDILYVFTLLFILVMLEPVSGNAWSQIVSVRSVTRGKYFASILVTHGIKTALFVLAIPLSCYVLCFFYPITFQDDWGLITAAGTVLSRKPYELVLLSIILLFLRFFCLGLAAKLVTSTTRVRAWGIIIYLLLSFGIDAGNGVFNMMPNELSMLNNTLVSIDRHGEWSHINTEFALFYWLAIVLLLVCLGYYLFRKIDLSDKGA